MSWHLKPTATFKSLLLLPDQIKERVGLVLISCEVSSLYTGLEACDNN